LPARDLCGIRTVSYTEVSGTTTVTLVAVDRAANASGLSDAMSGSTN
jgi:hypothetical protein